MQTFVGFLSHIYHHSLMAESRADHIKAFLGDRRRYPFEFTGFAIWVGVTQVFTYARHVTCFSYDDYASCQAVSELDSLALLNTLPT